VPQRLLRFSVGLILAVAAGRASRAHAEDALERRTLDQAADHHAQMGAVLRERTWNADTVRRLKLWAQGQRAAATPADVVLLRDEIARPVALSVSGAVSLGSYQGGFLYYYLRALTATRELARRSEQELGTTWLPPEQGSPLSLVTGASSGSINAFIAALASCQPPVRAPRASLFWNVWLPVGGKALTSDVRVRPDGLLSLTPIDGAVTIVDDAWKGPWSSAPCAVDVGLNTTRMRARRVKPLEGINLELPFQTEKLMFRLRGPGSAQPALSPFSWPPGDARDALYRKLFRKIGPPDRPLGFHDVTDVLRASSAFSFAFPPQWLHLTARDAKPGDDASDNELFTDGGVFDDRPVGLAVQMQRWRLGAEGKDEATSHTRYIVQDPDVTLWQPYRETPSPARDEPPLQPFLDAWLPFLGDFIETSFEIELIDTLEREATLYDGLEIPARRVPVAGAYLMEFLAFAEQDFRVFDFFTGMVDAWQQLAESSLAFQVVQATGGGPTFDDAPEFDCLVSWRAHQLMNAGSPPASACAAVGRNPEDPLLRQNLEALVHASAVTLAWSPAPHERKKGEPPIPSDQQVFLQALGTAPIPYWYRELKYRGTAATARTVDLAIRDHIQDIIERTTFDQPEGMGRFVLGSVGKALANYYAYRPPSVFAAAGLLSDRGFELQGAFRLPWDRWRPAPFELRLDGALRVVGIHLSTFDTQPEPSRLAAFTYMAAAHLTNEFQLQKCSLQLQSAVQFHLGAGWAVESLQTWNGPLLWRHGPEVLVGLAVFQRFYLDVVTNFYLDDCAGNNRCARAEPNLSDKLPPLVDASWGLRFALGYRFFVD
jgi:hypothetical protein